MPLALAAMVLAARPQAPDPGFGGGVEVGLTLADLTGQPITRPVEGQPFRVRVRLSNPSDAGPVRDEHLSGWIRPVEPSNGQCRDAARSYFVNQGALPRGSTDLGRSLYGVRHQDGTVSIIDWEHSIASANIMALVRLPGAAGPLAALPDAFSFLAMTGDGQRILIPAAEGSQPRELPALAGEGRALISPEGWLARGTQLLPPSGGQTIGLPGPVRALASGFADPDEGQYGGVLALLQDGRAVPADAGGAAPPVQGPAGATDAAHAAQADAVLFVDGSRNLTVVYAGNRSSVTGLPAPASRVSASPDGEFAIAWGPESPAFSIIEVATATVIQAVELNRAPLDQPIREVAFAEGAAFLLLKALDLIVVADLDQARRGAPAALRPVRLGPPVTDLPADAGPFLIQTRRGHGSGAVLALHPDLSTAFPVMRESGNATAPMNGFRIGGGRPLALAELAGGLTETAPGLYEAATVLNHGGPFELIVSAGPGSFTACARFEVEGEVQPGLVLQLVAGTQQADGGPVLDLRLLDEAGAAQLWPGDLPVLLQSLETGWRGQAMAAPAGALGHRLHLADVPPGLVSVSFDRLLPAGITVLPVTVELRK